VGSLLVGGPTLAGRASPSAVAQGRGRAGTQMRPQAYSPGTVASIDNVPEHRSGLHAPIRQRSHDLSSPAVDYSAGVAEKSAHWQRRPLPIFLRAAVMVDLGFESFAAIRACRAQRFSVVFGRPSRASVAKGHGTPTGNAPGTRRALITNSLSTCHLILGGVYDPHQECARRD
jgi:hypothetical protein